MINYKFTKKQIIIIISIFLSLIIIGLAVPFYGFIQNKNKDVPLYCYDQTRMLMPNNYRYISYLDFDLRLNGKIIVKAKTFFDITLQTIKYNNGGQCF